MRIFDETKTNEISSPDLALGYLKPEKLFIAHHGAVAGVDEQGHYETVAEYPNGGKDVEWVVDVQAVEAKEAYDEYEDIQVYVLYTEEELAEKEIDELKQKLAETDYKAIKYAEGIITKAEYEETKAQRQAWRKRINELGG